MSRQINPEVTRYIHIAKGIAETFGANCEVVVHDFADLERSIVAIFNGHVTGRSLTTPMPDYSLDKIKQSKEGNDIYNYTSKSTLGRELKSTTMFIKDANEEVVGCVCINFDMTELVGFKNALNELTKVADDENTNLGDVNKVNDVLIDMVQDTINKFGRPIIYLNKDEKVSIVRDLDDKGVFLIKGAVEYVANALNVSRYTIYNYLDGIREGK